MQNSISPATSTPLNRNFYQVIQSYVQLTKPRIIVLLLVTTGA
ncbi:MAG: heme o synthase, partial [Cyanobacteriota bacterium]